MPMPLSLTDTQSSRQDLHAVLPGRLVVEAVELTAAQTTDHVVRPSEALEVDELEVEPETAREP